MITGAASGIGKEIALAFAREGAKVVIADLDPKAAKETAFEIDPLLHRALGVAMDVSNEEQVEAGIARVIETFGRLDILISNAGVQIVAPLVEFEFAKWKKLLSIHLDGAFLTTRAALRHMYRQNSGSIIYMGSVHSKEASPLKAPYVTAKHGLIGLAKVVAKEGAAHGVRANVICPGFVRTPLVEKQIPEQARELGISEADVVRTVMLKETVDGEFTTATFLSPPLPPHLAFQVDLWSARGELSGNLAEVAMRQKEIQFSSRTRANTDQFKQQQRARNKLATLLSKLPPELRAGEEARFLSTLADHKVYSLVQLIYRSKQHEGHSKDYEFSRLSMEEHWRAGYHDAVRSLRHPEALQRPRNQEGVSAFDFAVDGRE